MHYTKETPSCSTFRVITINFRVSEILGFLRYLPSFSDRISKQTVTVVEWLERLAVLQKVAGSSPARAKDWKNLTVHPAANGYVINVKEG